MCAGTHPFTDWQTQLISPKERYLAAGRADAVAGPAAADLRRPRARRRPGAGEGDPDRQRAVPVRAALPRAVGVLPVLGRLRHRPGLGAHQGLRGHADRRAALPALGLGRVRDLHGDADLHATRSRASARSGGTSARTRTSAPWSCASATACPPSTRSARWPRCRSASSSSSTPSSTAATPCRRPASWVLRENKWRAARYGLDADIVVDEKGTVRPVRQAILDLVEDLMPTAKRLGCEAELADVERVLAVGASYQRQRAVAAAYGGDLRPVVDSLLAEMRDGLPRPAAGRPVRRGGGPRHDPGRREARRRGRRLGRRARRPAGRPPAGTCTPTRSSPSPSSRPPPTSSSGCARPG